MSRSESCKVWKVWKRYGSRKAAPVGRFPYLPYLPYLCPAHTHTRVHTRARTRVCVSFLGMEGMEGMEIPHGIRLAGFHTFNHRYGRYGNAAI